MRYNKSVKPEAAGMDKVIPSLILPSKELTKAVCSRKRKKLSLVISVCKASKTEVSTAWRLNFELVGLIKKILRGIEGDNSRKIRRFRFSDLRVYIQGIVHNKVSSLSF